MGRTRRKPCAGRRPTSALPGRPAAGGFTAVGDSSEACLIVIGGANLAVGAGGQMFVFGYHVHGLGVVLAIAFVLGAAIVYGVTLLAAVHALRISEREWQRIGRNKALWIIGMALGLVRPGFALIVSGYLACRYMTDVRARFVAPTEESAPNR